MSKKIAIQSYCFRNFKDNAEVAEKLLATGASAIELCAVHADFFDPDGFKKIVGIYKDAGVEIVSIGVNMLDGTEKDLRIFESAQAAGIDVMSVTFPAVRGVEKILETTQKNTEKFGVKCAIHNHGGYDWLGSVPALKMVFSMCGDGIGLCFDSGWGLDAMGNKLTMREWMETFKERLYNIHLKDFVFDKIRSQQDVVFSTGNIDLEDFKAGLAAADYNGDYIIEFEGSPENPIPELSEGVKIAGGLL